MNRSCSSRSRTTSRPPCREVVIAWCERVKSGMSPSQADGSQSLDLQRDALRTDGAPAREDWDL